ncbi:transcription factor cwo-like [Octopus vulgaris]|uniref:Transcription factor cwo-like n=1 Tax=Octopus vulgaris TaxID=6645 RepID=A0AA36F2L6_OCTVU|nr:transcription factor cwo-like [Octopus vulgaris]
MIMDNSEYLMEDMARQGSNGVKLELNDSPLNFATSVEDYEMHGPPTKKPKTPRDPMSHRIIEKRRRDRMNNCLADLSRLIPANYMKQGQGRIEKTEIIEMAIRHIKHLQNIHRSLVNQGQCCAEKFYLGFKECEAETIRYFVECEGLDNKDQFFMRVISHLEAVSKKHLATGSQNCTDFPKEEPSSGDKANISCSSLNAECENNKMKSNDRTPQTVPEILAPSHDSINSAASKQLRSLLSQGNAGFEQPDSGNASCADSLGMFSSSESSISGNNADEANINMNNGEGDMHYHGNVGSENGSSSGSSKENKFTNYKFKHDITKRFSEEEKYSVDLSASLTQENIIEYQESHNFEKIGYEKHSKDKHGYDKHGHDKHDKHGHDKHSHDKHDKHSHDKHGHDKHSHDKHSHDKHGYDKHEKHGYDKHGFEKHEKLSSKLKRKIVRSTSPSSCSDSTAYPTSEHSSNGASNNVSTMLCRSPEDETKQQQFSQETG